MGWRTVAKKNYVKLEEKKKHYFKFYITVSLLFPLLHLTQLSQVIYQLGSSLYHFRKGVQNLDQENKKKKKKKSLFEPFVGQLSSYSTLREKLSLLTSFKLFHMGDSLM